ncbi:3-hydroxyacyl-CoA dehydrogenase family protein [Sediminibacterium soli]|uniref:3-hydroxyacyl-CoA dehydrogenase family protein n=1 Tax=Sediminibacterium soli TaxID=2698829 RepID=UPI00137AD291|nr:3-hydroxyacyl-CoA dehydrogenase NAD-binding domain-containing protein [Sediminibacterium soli]NCI47805.1 3-hydroxybutyryl-CoA dehydrogenase [Sediminibacterium soli]
MTQTICICGAGTMGSGIAQVAAQAGFRTLLFDVNAAMLEKGRSGIEKNLGKLVEKGRITETDRSQAISRLSYTGEINSCIADLVIEAIVEQKQAKLELFQQLAAVNTKKTIFATNTSSLSISELAAEIPFPQRVAGMHFFNPAPLMKLVEVVRAAQTSEEVIQAISAIARQMGKTPVFCKDAPGFIVNRVARHYYLEAMKLVEQGYTDIAAIDAVMQATGFKMGPFALMDLIGMDINYSVSGIVWNALGRPERLTPSPVQAGKVARGELGRKTGKGFYEYNS